MGASLLFGLLKNNWQLAACVLAIVIGATAWWGEHGLLLHARTVISDKQALLDEVKSEAQTQAAKARAINAQQKANSDVIQAQLQSAYAAHNITADALSAAVVRYENLRGACALPGTPAGATGGAGARSIPGASGQAGATIGALVKACQHDADELRACQAFAKTCGAQTR